MSHISSQVVKKRRSYRRKKKTVEQKEMSDTEINDTYSNCIEIEHKSRTILFENENNRSERKAELLNSIIIECSQASENLLYKDKMDTLSKKQVNKCYSLFTKYILNYDENFKKYGYSFDDAF
jgi:hypothetical protein